MDFAVAIFVASLAGSPHCAAMCGPFLAFAAAGDAGSKAGRRHTMTAYHIGRLVSYLVLGLIAGALGAGVEQLGHLAGLGRAAALVSGAMMVTWGIHTLLVHAGWRARLHVPGVLHRALGNIVRRLGTMPGAMRAGVTGLATALLPCGWLYVFVAAAGGTGSPGRAVLVMLLFWTGTLPVMTTVGMGLQRLAGPASRHLPLVSAIVVVGIGLFTIAGRLRPAETPVMARPQVHAGHR